MAVERERDGGADDDKTRGEDDGTAERGSDRAEGTASDERRAGATHDARERTDRHGRPTNARRAGCRFGHVETAASAEAWSSCRWISAILPSRTM